MKKNSITSSIKKNLSQPNVLSTAELSNVETLELRACLSFLFRFAILFILFEIAYITPFVYNYIFQPVNHLFAFWGYKILLLMGYNVVSDSIDTIGSAQFTLSIKRGCDSMEALAIFIFGVMAFPSTLKRKVSGLLIGSFIILLVNLVRVIHLFWVGIHHLDLFNLFHLEIWQFYFIAQSIILWLIWMKWAITPEKT